MKIIKIIFFIKVVIHLGACGGSEVSSRLHHSITSDVSLETVKRMVGTTERLVIVNLATSRSTYITYPGQIMGSWNSVTADVTGYWHKREGTKVPQSTPPGVYSIHTIQHCPVWRPASPKDPATKKRAQNEADRQRIFDENPEIYGPCGELNPLGEYVAWFYGAYGWHGSALAHHWRFVSELPLRRASGGCIRNPQDRTRAIFGDFLEHPAFREFKNRVEKNSVSSQPQTLTLEAVDRRADIKIIVGDFPNLSYELPELKDPMHAHILREKQLELERNSAP